MRRLHLGEGAKTQNMTGLSPPVNIAGMLRMLGLLLAATLVSGCGGKSQTYQVMVRNESPRSVTVWLTKNAGPPEPGWKTPEDVAIENLGRGEPLGGVIIPPGKVGETGKVRGSFPVGIEAVLRVYIGQHGFDDLLAISRGSPNRIDVNLHPGANELIVRERRGAIVVERADPAGAGG